MWTSETKTKSHVTSNSNWHVIYCLILPKNNVMVSLKDEFTIWRQSQKDTR